MTRRSLTIVACALVLSACISYLVYRAFGTRPPTVKAAQTAQIVVAARDLQIGALIRGADLKTAAWFGSVPNGALVRTDSALNRAVASTIYAGEPVTENRLAPQGSAGGLAATIPTGMRACAVKVNEVVGLAGFVVPGMRVDVLITGQPPGGSALDGPHVKTLLQNIQVLSAGTNFLKDQEGKPEQAQVVNLLVTPAQAEILSLASNETHIQLVLRNPTDTEVAGQPGTMMSDLFGSTHPKEAVPVVRRSIAPPPRPEVKPVPVEIKPPPPYVVEVLNGSAHTQAKFSPLEAKQ